MLEDHCTRAFRLLGSTECIILRVPQARCSHADIIIMKKNIRFNENASLKELINIIYNCHTSLSNHTGLTVHVAAAFKKNIIDIVSPELNLHYDRWIPNKINYKRYNVKNFTDIFI